MSAPGVLAVDAGGSRTRALAAPPSGDAREFECASVNPSASGAAADQALRELFRTARAVLGDCPVVGWLASASVDPDRAEQEKDRVRRVARETGWAGPLVLSNDLTPLLWGVPALSGRGVIVVCGTGSGFLGGDGNGRLARAGGCEYLGSDEGSACDLGLKGLRAAVRALDGRGVATCLVPDLAAWAGCSPPELARRLAARPYPKQALADLAPVVCRAWLAGDAVAGKLVSAAVAELTLGVRAVRDQLGLSPGFAVAAIGGVLDGCPELSDVLADRLVAELHVAAVTLITDTPAVVRDALRRMLSPNGTLRLPDGLRDQHAWLIDG